VPKRDFATQAGKFAKHVLPAAVKPVHSLWHEIIGFVFLFVTAVCAWGIYRNAEKLGPGRVACIAFIGAVTAIYGVSSFLKARRISRS
jgi:hypothetical protein